MHSRVERSRYVAAKLKNPLKPLLKNADCIRFRLPAPTKIWEKVAPKHAISDTTTGPAWQADPFFPPRSGFVQPEVRGTTARLRRDSRPVSRVSEGILGAVMLVLRRRPGKAFRVSTWQLGTSGASDSWCPDCAQSLLAYPGFSQAWLVVVHGASGSISKPVCTSASSYLRLSKADLRPPEQSSSKEWSRIPTLDKPTGTYLGNGKSGCKVTEL